MELYKTECNKLDLEKKQFYTKKKMLEYCLTNPLIDYFYSDNNKYFISNSSESNMEEVFRLSPSKDFSTYEHIFDMFSVSNQDEYYEEIPYYFKKFRNDNIAFVIKNILVLSEPFSRASLYRLVHFMLKDGLEEIFGDQEENAAKIIQKNWTIWKRLKNI